MVKKKKLWLAKIPRATSKEKSTQTKLGILNRRLIRLAEKSIAADEEINELAQKTGDRSLDDFLNFSLFVHLFELDIQIVSHELMVSKLEYYRVFFSKEAALLIFEYLQSIHHVFNKFAKTPPLYLRNEIEPFKPILKKFSKLKDNYPKLKNVRNIVSAHRHHDSLEFLKITKEIDTSQYQRLISELDEVNLLLGKQLTQCFKKILSELSGVK